jgi:hypothetical protein
LADAVEELECIFRAGQVPDKVPMGALHGDMLSLLGEPHPWLRSFVTSGWKGKFLSRSPCSSSSPGIFQGWNYMLGNAYAPFVASIGKLQDFAKAHPSYTEDGKESLFFNYGFNFDKECPELRSLMEARPEAFSIKKSPMNKAFYPTHRFLDELRLVGRQVDGGAILLGTGYLRDPYTSGAAVVSERMAYFSLLSYDAGLNKDFAKGQSLQPLVKSTSFKFMLY